MSNNPQNASSRTAATPVGGGTPRRKWVLPLLVAVLVVIVLLLVLSRCGGDDDKTTTAGTPSTPATTSSTAATTSSTAATTSSGDPSGSTASGGDGERGTVTAAGVNLLGRANLQKLTANDGGQAVGRDVEVESVPADEGFWIGSSKQDRLWVQLTGTGGESTYKVKQGDTVDFTGTVTRAEQGFATKVGLNDAEGAGQLTDQGSYISVPASSVKLSD